MCLELLDVFVGPRGVVPGCRRDVAHDPMVQAVQPSLGMPIDGLGTIFVGLAAMVCLV